MGSKTRVELGAMPIRNLDSFGRLVERGPNVFDNSKPFANGELPNLLEGQLLAHFGILTLGVRSRKSKGIFALEWSALNAEDYRHVGAAAASATA